MSRISSRVALLAASFFAAASFAAEPVLTPDLQAIADAGEVVIGVRESALPYSYMTRDGTPTGYTIALCQKVVDNLRKTLNRPDLRVRYNSVTPITRTLLIRERVIDLECGATSHTLARDKRFAFSLAFGVEQAQLISLSSKPYRRLEELAGRKIVVIDGSTSHELLAAQKAAGKLAAELVPVRNYARAYFVMKDGKADAYYGSFEIFLGEVLTRGGKTADFLLTAAPGAVEPLAIMMKSDKLGLKAVADRTVAELAKSGELRTSYSKWFEQPLAGYGVGLALAPSPAWQAMLAAPHDRPAD